MLIKRFTRNTVGRDLIIGDIHGCFTRAREALDNVGFNRERDRLFSVGDLVDRGPESDQVTDWLEWVHAVRGNHEEAAIQYAAGGVPAHLYITGFGGGWNVANPQVEQQRLADAFAALPVAIELETAQGLVAIVHADCSLPNWADAAPILEAGGRRAQALQDCFMWSRDRFERADADEVAGVRAVVVGHTPMERFTSLGNVLYIDTEGWRRGYFTILNAETLRPETSSPAKQLNFES